MSEQQQKKPEVTYSQVAAIAKTLISEGKLTPAWLDKLAVDKKELTAPKLEALNKELEEFQEAWAKNNEG